MKNMNDFHYEGKPSCATNKSIFLLSAKMIGTQKRTPVSPLGMHCMYCSMPKGTTRFEAMSYSEKIKPVALAVIELCLSEGISHSVTQLLIQ